MSKFEELVNTLRILSSNKNPLLVAIDGVGGSGKSVLADLLKRNLDKVSIVSIDDFYIPELNHADRLRIVEQFIKSLKEGQNAKYQKFDWGENKLTEWISILPEGVIILEGVSTLHDDLYKYFDYKIWIECPPEVGFKRGLLRDKEGYKVDTTDEWIKTWMPQEKEYKETQQPHKKADLILNYDQLPKIIIGNDLNL